MNRGSKITQVLKQNKYSPYDLGSQVAIIWAATNGYLDDMPVSKVEEFEKKFLTDLRTRGRVLIKRINEKKILEKKDEEELKKFVQDNLPVAIEEKVVKK